MCDKNHLICYPRLSSIARVTSLYSYPSTNSIFAKLHFTNQIIMSVSRAIPPPPPVGTGSKMLPLFDSESFPNKCRRSELSTCSTKSISATVLYILELSTSVLNSKAFWTITVFSLMRLTPHMCSYLRDFDFSIQDPAVRPQLVFYISHISTSYSFNIVHYCTILSATSMISQIYF